MGSLKRDQKDLRSVTQYTYFFFPLKKESEQEQWMRENEVNTGRQEKRFTRSPTSRVNISCCAGSSCQLHHHGNTSSGSLGEMFRLTEVEDPPSMWAALFPRLGSHWLQRRKSAEHQHPSLCFLPMDRMWPAASCFSGDHAYPTMMDCVPWSSTCLWEVFCHSNETSKPRDLAEMWILRPHPDLLNQNLCKPGPGSKIYWLVMVIPMLT